MTNFDTRPKAGLSAEDEAFLKNLEEGESMFSQLGATFTGPMKAWTGVAFVLSFVFLALAVWSLIRMLGASEVREMILWFAGFVFAMLTVAMIKIWFWMRMNHLALLRELKRLELRLARGRT
jgi:hypothetical protein